jgi:putative membrane protein insertion efficiency factor
MHYLWIMRKLLISPLIGLIYLYKYVISPVLPRGCRHFPSCSTYAIDALNLYGPFKGSVLAAHRIARCNPWGTHGYDPVPRFLFKKADLDKFTGNQLKKYPSCDRLKQH